MSILIKGMEMPKSCADCELAKHFDGYNENDCPFNSFSYYDCPLVPVPPHGRLIDADALEVIGYCGLPQGHEDTFDSGVMWLAEQIDKLPTIIPAEEGE